MRFISLHLKRVINKLFFFPYYQTNKMSSMIIPINDLDNSNYSEKEITSRCKLASVYRLIDLYGWSQTIFNHITSKADTESDHFLINPFGLLYHEITASSLIKVDIDGNVIDSGSTKYLFNRPGYHLHSAVHRARNDINAVLHLHHSACVAVSAMKCGLLAISQEAAVLGGISYHDYRGLAIDPEEGVEVAKDLGPVNKILILRNHGVLVCGETIEEMLHMTHNLVLACEAQVRLSGYEISRLIIISDKAKEQAHRVVMSGVQTQGLDTTKGEKRKVWDIDFEAQIRWLDSKGLKPDLNL